MKNSRNTLVNTNEVKHKHEVQMKTHEVNIMKTLNRKPPGLFKQAVGLTAGIFLLAILMPGSAFATTASNAEIVNTATIDYDDASGNDQTDIPASVTVTVTHVEAAPTLSAPADDTTPSTVSVDYTYTITNNSNGLDTYNLTETDTANDAGITTPVPAVFRDALDAGDITSIDLGATSLAVDAVATDTTIIVPNDGTADASQNGIEVGDTINIGGELVVVTVVTDTGAGTDTITFGPALAGPHAIGVQVGEVGTFIYRPTPVTSVSGDTVTLQVTATDGGANSDADSTITTVTLITLTVTKYVANTTAAVVGGGSTITVNTGLGAGNITYYTTNVTGDPGDVLEYVIGIANAAGSGTATDVIITDPVPNFTAQTGNIALDPGTGTWSNVATTADNGDFGEADATTVVIYAGTGGDDTAAGVGAGTGGSLAASTTTLGAFRVQITP